MPVPTEATYSAAALVAAQTSFLGLIDAGVAAGSIKIRDSGDVLLAEVPLSDPAGTVNGTTGQLAFDIAGPDSSADADGTAAYGEFCDSDGTVHLSLPTQAGTVAVSGKLILNTLSIAAGGVVYVLSATIG